MKTFLKKIILLIFPLFLMIGGIFVFTDIFKIFYHYDNFYHGTRVALNRTYVTTSSYLNNRDSYKFNSFIFGNSRSLSYMQDEWLKYISPDSKCFHFDEFGGSVSSLFEKIKLIDSKHDHIKNSLLIIDRSLLARLEQNEYLTCMPPVLTDFVGSLEFYRLHFRAFLDLRFQIAYWSYKLTKQYKPYMKDYIKSFDILHDSINCEYIRIEEENLISQEKYYTEERVQGFQNIQYSDSISARAIFQKQISYLLGIKRIFDKHQTNYRIVISPLFDQIKLHPEDSQILEDIFGKKNVFDFSGPNRWNNDYHNYYEWSHYRPQVANEILSEIYETN